MNERVGQLDSAIKGAIEILGQYYYFHNKYIYAEADIRCLLHNHLVSAQLDQVVLGHRTTIPLVHAEWPTLPGVRLGGRKGGRYDLVIWAEDSARICKGFQDDRSKGGGPAGQYAQAVPLAAIIEIKFWANRRPKDLLEALVKDAEGLKRSMESGKANLAYLVNVRPYLESVWPDEVKVCLEDLVRALQGVRGVSSYYVDCSGNQYWLPITEQGLHVDPNATAERRKRR